MKNLRYFLILVSALSVTSMGTRATIGDGAWIKKVQEKIKSKNFDGHRIAEVKENLKRALSSFRKDFTIKIKVFKKPSNENDRMKNEIVEWLESKRLQYDKKIKSFSKNNDFEVKAREVLDNAMEKTKKFVREGKVEDAQKFIEAKLDKMWNILSGD